MNPPDPHLLDLRLSFMRAADRCFLIASRVGRESAEYTAASMERDAKRAEWLEYKRRLEAEA